MFTVYKINKIIVCIINNSFGFVFRRCCGTENENVVPSQRSSFWCLFCILVMWFLGKTFRVKGVESFFDLLLWVIEWLLLEKFKKTTNSNQNFLKAKFIIARGRSCLIKTEIINNLRFLYGELSPWSFLRFLNGCEAIDLQFNFPSLSLPK